MRLEINFVHDMSCGGTGYTQNSSVNNILQQLKSLELENIVELTVRLCIWNEDLIVKLKNNMCNLQNIVKRMKNLCECKLILLKQNKIEHVPLEDLNILISMFKYSMAKKFVLKLGQKVNTDEHGLKTLNFPKMIDRLVIIGPCEGFLNKRLLIQTFAKEIVAKPVDRRCSINKVFGKNSHIPGICVVDIIKIVKNWSIERYNDINVADLVYMRQCCAFNVAAERFYSTLANDENKIKRHDYHNTWNRICS